MKLKKMTAFLLSLTAAAAALSLPAAASDVFGDINGDGAVNALDAAKILQYAAYVGAGGTLDLQGFLNGEEEQPPAEITDEDDTLTILAWTDYDLTMMQELYLQDYPDAQMEFILVGENGGNSASAFKDIILSGEQIDLYMAEPDWVNFYINNEDYVVPLSAVGLTEADYANSYSYAAELGRNKNGELCAASYYIAPGGFCYNADIAQEYLGVTTPEEMQVLVKDWDAFTATAGNLHTAAQGSITMTATLSGMWQCFSAETTQPVIRDGLLNTERVEYFTDLAKTFIDNGYVDTTINSWTLEWYETGKNGKTLGYFLPTWIVDDPYLFEQMKAEDANWAITEGPQEYYWGGMQLCVSPSCNSRTATEQFLRYFTADADSMEKFAEYSGYFVNNTTVTERLMESGKSNEDLGGQNDWAVFHNVAQNMDVTAANISDLDSSLNTAYFYETLMNNYEATAEEIIEIYKDIALQNYGVESAAE